MKWKGQGTNFEKEFSRTFHKKHCPVLVSSLLLREIHAGQIDMAGLQKKTNGWLLIIYELKGRLYPGSWQWARLRQSQDYLSKVLEMESKLEVKFCQKAEP